MKKTVLGSILFLCLSIMLGLQNKFLGVSSEKYTEPQENISQGDVIDLYRSERRKFVASVCDVICPNAPYLCRVAFCSVILNRVRNSEFPVTAAEVVKADPIFAQYFLNCPSTDPSNVTLMAFDDAESGFSPCPDALYYYSSKTPNMTLRKRHTLFQIGNYVFS